MSKLIGRRASRAVGAIAIFAQFGVPSASAQSASSLEARLRTGLSAPAPARDWPPSAMPPSNSTHAYSEKVAQLDGGCLWYIVTDTLYRDGHSDSLHTKTARPCDRSAPEVSSAPRSEDKAADNSPNKTDADNPHQGKPEAAHSGQEAKRVASQPSPKLDRRSSPANPVANAQSLRPTIHAPAPSRISALRRGTSHSNTFAHALPAPIEDVAPAYSGEASIAGLAGLAGFAILGGVRAHRFGGFFWR